MRKLVTLCAVVGLCAPLAAQAQGRSRDVARVERDDDSKDKGSHQDREKHKAGARDKEKDKAGNDAKEKGEHHDNGLHLGHRRGVGHQNDRGRGHDHHDHDAAVGDAGRACVDANRDGRCDFRADSSRTPASTQRFPVPTTTPKPAPLPVPTTRTEPVSSPTTVATAPRVEPTSTRGRLPEMVPVTMIEQKRRTSDQERWLGTGTVSGRYVDADRNGTPERITWLDGAGLVKQVWTDGNKDGRADSVAIYERGRLTHMVRE